MKYLYVCALIAVGSCSYAIGQERLTPQQREHASKEKAAHVRAGRKYDDMKPLQKLWQLQQWLERDIYNGLIAIQAGEAASGLQVTSEADEAESKPRMTIEKVRAALDDLHKRLNAVNSKPDSDEHKLAECDRIWGIELMNLITLKLLPAQDARSMFTALHKFKTQKRGN